MKTSILGVALVTLFTTTAYAEWTSIVTLTLRDAKSAHFLTADRATRVVFLPTQLSKWRCQVAESAPGRHTLTCHDGNIAHTAQVFCPTNRASADKSWLNVSQGDYEARLELSCDTVSIP